MADNYLEKKYDEAFGTKKVIKRIGHTLDELLTKNRSTRGYDVNFVMTRERLEKIVSVNSKIASGRNQQVLRFHLVIKENGAAEVLKYVKMGAALPELHLPFKGTEPNAFIICCSMVAENKIVDIDLGISIQSMLLRATEMGLNGLCILAFDKEAIKRELNLKYEPLAIVAVGKGIEQFELRTIKEDESHAYYRENGKHIVPKLGLEDLIF